MIPTNAFGVFPQGPLHGQDGNIHMTWDRFLRAIYARTGGSSGVPFTMHAAVIGGANNILQAPTLSEDFNVVVSGPAAKLPNLQPGQSQQVTNNTGGNLTIFPPTSLHNIDNLNPGVGYVLANGKSQRFTKTTNNAFLSLQLG